MATGQRLFILHLIASLLVMFWVLLHIYYLNLIHRSEILILSMFHHLHDFLFSNVKGAETVGLTRYDKDIESVERSHQVITIPSSDQDPIK